MNVIPSRVFNVLNVLPCTRRTLMVATQQNVLPIPCKKGKPRKLDKEVDPRKKMIAARLKAAVESPYFIFFQYGDLKNSEWNDLRYELGKHNIKIKVFPNKLSSKVLQGTKYENFSSLFKSSTAACFSPESNLKALLDVTKGFPKLSLMGGKVDNEILSRNQITEHSKLPSIDMMRAILSQLIMQPAQKLTSTLAQSQQQLSVNLEQYVSQNSQQSVGE